MIRDPPAARISSAYHVFADATDQPPDDPSAHVAPDQYCAQSTGTGSFSWTTPSTAFFVHM